MPSAAIGVATHGTPAARLDATLPLAPAPKRNGATVSRSPSNHGPTSGTWPSARTRPGTPASSPAEHPSPTTVISMSGAARSTSTKRASSALRCLRKRCNVICSPGSAPATKMALPSILATPRPSCASETTSAVSTGAGARLPPRPRPRLIARQLPSVPRPSAGASRARRRASRRTPHAQ